MNQQTQKTYVADILQENITCIPERKISADINVNATKSYTYIHI